jgi:hypothetical protein
MASSTAHRMGFACLSAITLLGCDPGAATATSPGGAAVENHAPAVQAEPRPAANSSRTTPDPATIQRAVDAMLRAEYPAGFDASHRCWRTERAAEGEASAYCMRALPHHAVSIDGETSVYVALASASDITGNLEYLYGHADPGAMDAYRLTITPDGSYQVTAKGVGLLFGSAGDCGCTTATFVQAGPRVHGWLFSSGGTWQGTTVATHSLVALVDGTFKDVAGLPRFREDDQALEYRVAIVRDAGSAWYPLQVSRLRDGKPDGARQVEFDPLAERYPTPADF